MLAAAVLVSVVLVSVVLVSVVLVVLVSVASAESVWVVSVALAASVVLGELAALVAGLLSLCVCAEIPRKTNDVPVYLTTCHRARVHPGGRCGYSLPGRFYLGHLARC